MVEAEAKAPLQVLWLQCLRQMFRELHRGRGPNLFTTCMQLVHEHYPNSTHAQGPAESHRWASRSPRQRLPVEADVFLHEADITAVREADIATRPGRREQLLQLQLHE
mmetsp:Transcript_114364/g.198251  ORF Transcript_114364/g.198251 Transcript_114364/m.198251 type:complete len:108 (-) Transcript_114364:34-357(-)